MEFIEINGVRVPVPPEVVSAGREAVAAWAQAQIAPAPPTASPTTRPAREE